ncbi:hypothetical protein E2C01_055465 [Portunus trituberculatus]|uniref:Secreted protein n=1 Tax=Portunus trituberculatus TaxID=210409 RepID=A0A5B7GUT3_PORTR|nr:hypothetical protein [Portunus trituberculatus]
MTTLVSLYGRVWVLVSLSFSPVARNDGTLSCFTPPQEINTLVPAGVASLLPHPFPFFPPIPNPSATCIILPSPVPRANMDPPRPPDRRQTDTLAPGCNPASILPRLAPPRTVSSSVQFTSDFSD